MASNGEIFGRGRMSSGLLLQRISWCFGKAVGGASPRLMRVGENMLEGGLGAGEDVHMWEADLARFFFRRDVQGAARLAPMNLPLR